MSNDEQVFFGQSFQEVVCDADPTMYKSQEIGEFYYTINAEGDAGRKLNRKSFPIVLSIIHEKFLAKKPVLLCVEAEKETLIDYRDGATTNLTFREILSIFPQSIFEKQNRSLLNLYNLNNTPGKTVTGYSKWTFFTSDTDEYYFLLTSMIKKNLIKGQVIRQNASIEIEALEIAEKGWETLEQLILKNTSSKRVFVAMWFHESTNKAYVSIKNALQKLNFEPVRIDQKEHNNEISGEILYEISRCKFIIADVTEQRHGVYFEAGFALGLKIPVIWSCRKDDLANVHFDTRQYNHVIWENETELEEKIVNRVKGTILLASTGTHGNLNAF